ncbi:PAS domain-containing sensor histidine kinase [bacterium]|nr:MAG: PAS domain-containing sensor histidine kinase [bacterium]
MSPKSTSFTQTHYQLLLDSVTDYIYTVSIVNEQVSDTKHGPACFNVTGYTQHELEEDEDLWFTMVHDDDRKLVLEQAALAKLGKTVKEIEHRITHKDGSIRWVRNTIVVRFDDKDDSKVVGYDGLIQNITDKKLAEEALRSSEQRYRNLLNSITDYIYTVTVDKGKVVKTEHGPACVKVTGYTSEEYVEDEELWYRMIVEEDRKEVVRFANKAVKGESIQPFEHRIIHKDGTIRWVRNTIVARKDSTGSVLAYDGLISDITDRKKAEQLATLQKEQLIQAEKMVTLGILVSGVAHEINNPNNFIMLNARMLQKIWLDVEQHLDCMTKEKGSVELAGIHYPAEKEQIHRLLQAVTDGGKRIQKIVTGLKDFARQDTGEMKAGVSINEIVNQAVLIVNNLIQKATNRFELDLNTQIPVIKGNFQKLEQVLINLITNSCQALTDKNQRLTIQTGLTSSNKEVFIRVIDEGKGIDDDVMKHMFDPFFTTKRDTGGTGLGLSISYTIVKDHGGELYFKRDQQKTIATIKLPV